MPAATTKPDLIAVTLKEFAKLQSLMEDVTPEQALLKREDDTSIKDVIAHRAHWIHLFLGWYRDGQAGKDVYFPAKGYKWNDLKAYNAALRVKHKHLSWGDACAGLTHAHEALLTQIDALDDAALYGGPMKGGKSAWTTGRWAEAAGPSHYRSAAKWIKACLRADAAAAP